MHYSYTLSVSTEKLIVSDETHPKLIILRVYNVHIVLLFYFIVNCKCHSCTYHHAFPRPMNSSYYAEIYARQRKEKIQDKVSKSHSKLVTGNKDADRHSLSINWSQLSAVSLVQPWANSATDRSNLRIIFTAFESHKTAETHQLGNESHFSLYSALQSKSVC